MRRARPPLVPVSSEGFRGRGRACRVSARLAALLALLAVAGCASWWPIGLDEESPVVNGNVAYSTTRDGDTWQGLPVRQIYAAEPDGRTEAALTSLAASGCSAGPGAPDRWCSSRSPVWSPDGTRIAFISDREGGYEEDDVYLMNADGSAQTRLTFGGDGDLHEDVAWSPDGLRLAYAARAALPSDVEEGVFDVLVVDSDGTHLANLTADPGANDRSPAWSPDGGKIAFVSNRDGNDDIFVMNADGSESVNLTADAAHDTNPAWSPDGGKIAFARWQIGTRGILVMDADGANQRWLFQRNGLEAGQSWVNEAPAWSPDGSMLTFAAGPWGSRDVYVVRVDGTYELDLSDDPSDDAVPEWSPDGTEVAFLSDRDGGFDLYATGSDSADFRRLTHGAGYAFDHHWGRLPAPAPGTLP